MTGKKNRASKVQETFTKDNPLRAGSLKLFVGAKIEALDSRRWYQAKVVKINESTRKVLVHFEGWNARHDTWFEFDSTSLRPLRLFETSQDQSSKRKELKPGDRVLARWSDSKFYPAKVHSLVNEKVVEVIFFDGFKKRLNKNGIRPDPKKTFENFEEKFTFPPLEGHHITTPVSSAGESKIEEPTSSASSSRTKRRHTEPSTMADFVTSIPGKRPKHYLGTASDSEDLLSPHDFQEYKTKEDDMEHLGTSSGAKRGLALRKQRRMGYPVEEDLLASSTGINRSSSDVSVKMPPKNQLPSSAESLVSGIDSDNIGDFEKTDSQSSSKFAKRKLSNILQIKLPMKMQGKKRGRKKRFFRLHKDDLGAKRDPCSAEEKVQLGGTEIEKPAPSEKSESSTDDVQPISSRPEKDQKCSSDKTSEASVLKPATDVKLSSNKDLAGKEGEVSEENKTVLKSNMHADSKKSISESAVQSSSVETVRIPKKRGRKPGKMNSAKKSSIREPKILPRRERKLTEKGLELLQTITHKKGTDCHLKEAFVCVDVLENISLKSDVSDSHKLGVLEKLGTGISDGSSKRQSGEIYGQKVNIDVEEEPKFSGEKHVISCGDTVMPASEPLGVSSEKKEESHTADSHTMPEAHHLSKDDDKYSDSCSEGSGGLVIDVADDPKVRSDSGAVLDESQSDSLSKDSQGKSFGASNEKSMDAKTRTFARLKYTLSHEERKGNKLAKLKKKRFRKKLKGQRGRGRKENLKESRSVAVESQKSQLLDENELPSSSQSSVGVSPLESLTRMVTETSQTIGLSSNAKVAPVSDVGLVNASIEETSKPVKSTKQQRAPYKSRLKVTDSFLSMVEQDRPSQIERPLSDDLIKEKSLRGRPRHRTTNRAESQHFQETIVPKREELQQSDLNEPLEFSSPGSTMETIDLSETDIPRMVYHRQEMPSFVGEQSRYGPPPHVGPFPVPSSTMIGQMRMPHPPQQIELFRDGSPQGSIPAISIANSGPPGYERRAKNAPHIAAYQGTVGVSDMRGPMLDYPTQLQPLVGSTRMTDSSGQVPRDCTTRCLRLQKLSIVKQEPWESQKRTDICPCQECRDSKPTGSIGTEKGDIKRDGGTSNQVVSNVQGENNNSRMNEESLLSNVTNTEKGKSMDREILITDVFSLRDSGSMASNDKKTGKFEVKEQKSVGCKSHGSPGLKESLDATRVVSKETSEPVHSTTKPKGFETKKKRLDFITGKLSAQKRMSPNIDDAFKKSDKNGSNSSSPALLKDSSVAATEDSARTHSPYNSQITVASDPQLKQQQQLGYIYPQTTFIPVINPYFEPQPGVPPSSMDVPPQRVVSPESHMVAHHPLYMDPRPYYRSPEYFQPIPSVFDAEGVPPPGYQHPPPGIAYMPPDMVGQMRFHQLPGFPYGSPRFAPAPRYFVPREPMATARPPPPYGTFPMVSANQRFRAIAPSGRIPLVVCKQANCNCHLPHSAPPIQVVPSNTQPSQVPEKTAEDDAVFSKAQQMVKGSEPMMKVDPRRLTLPLQRMKKMGLKPQKDSKDSLNLEGKQEQPYSDDVEKEGADSNGNAEEHGDFEAASRQSVGESTQSKARNEDGKVSKLETPKKTGTSRRHEKGLKKEAVLAPREFVVDLDLNEFQCKYKGCRKSFRKASSRDNHQRYFHSPRAPQKRQKPLPSLQSLAPCDSLLSPAPGHAKIDPKASNEDLTSIRSGYSSSVVTDENVSDREKQEESSSDESDDSFMDSNGSVCIDDVIRCKCGDLEEQGFMIQCEQCFTWQHGDCVNLTVQTVPKNYLCYICLNPKGLRPSFKYKNNYDWYKRGALPSLVEIQDENQEKIAELMQASHALMEDIANVFDVIDGMKRKIALLNKKSHPALKLWEPVEEPKDKETTDSKVVGQSNDTSNIPSRFGAVDDQNNVEKDDSKMDEQKSDPARETNLVMSNDSGNLLGKSKADNHTENTSIEKDSQVTNKSDQLRTFDNGTGGSVPAKEAKDTEIGIVNKTSKDSSFLTAVIENRIDSENLEIAESEPLDIVKTKLKLQDHLDDIEGKLNERMDEIEKNLDVLELKYAECEKKANEGESKSAFKVTLPDMTSVVRHLNLINRQLMNLS